MAPSLWTDADGKILCDETGKPWFCEECPCCPDEPPEVECTPCTTYPGTVQIQISGMGDDFCLCAGWDGQWDALLIGDGDDPCVWGADIGPLSTDCFPVDADRYDRINASVTDDGTTATYFLQILDTLSGHQLTFTKTVVGGTRLDCMTQWNNGGWTVGDGMMVDCDASGIVYEISAF